MDNRTGATVFLLVASVFTACAGATKPDVPDTETQRKVRTDLEQCNAASGDKGYGDAVTPEGKYSFLANGQDNGETILTCMASKGYSSRLVILEPYGYVDRSNPNRFRVGGEGAPSR
jgi:hypothetical protein